MEMRFEFSQEKFKDMYAKKFIAFALVAIIVIILTIVANFNTLVKPESGLEGGLVTFSILAPVFVLFFIVPVSYFMVLNRYRRRHFNVVDGKLIYRTSSSEEYIYTVDSLESVDVTPKSINIKGIITLTKKDCETSNVTVSTISALNLPNVYNRIEKLPKHVADIKEANNPTNVLKSEDIVEKKKESNYYEFSLKKFMNRYFMKSLIATLPGIIILIILGFQSEQILITGLSPTTGYLVIMALFTTILISIFLVPTNFLVKLYRLRSGVLRVEGGKVIFKIIKHGKIKLKTQKQYYLFTIDNIKDIKVSRNRIFIEGRISQEVYINDNRRRLQAIRKTLKIPNVFIGVEEMKGLIDKQLQALNEKSTNSSIITN